MPVSYSEDAVLLSNVCTVEEAESLQDWLLAHPDGRLELGPCTHVHSAVLQLLLRSRSRIAELPSDPEHRRWLEWALAPSGGSALEGGCLNPGHTLENLNEVGLAGR